MIVKQVLALAIAAGAAALSWAEDKVTPVTTGGGDLADPSIWSGGALPSTTAHAGISGGVYTLSEDMSVYSVSMKGKDVTFDFTDGSHTMTLTKSCSGWGGYSSTFQCYHDAYGPSVTFKGGRWNASRKTFSFTPLGNSGDHLGHHVVVTNGCIISNAYECSVATRINNSHIKICDKSELWVSGDGSGTGRLRIGYVDGTNNVFEACSGAKVMALYLKTDEKSSGAVFARDRFDFHDAGTVALVGPRSGNYTTSYIGCDFGGCGLRVADGAVLDAPVNEMCVGYNSTATNGWLEVLNGASATLKFLYSKSNGNSVLISNATMTVKQHASIGSGGSATANNRMTITGPNALLTSEQSSSYDLYGRMGHHGTVILSDGAKWRATGSQYCGQVSNNLFRVTGSGTVYDGTYHLGSSTNHYQFNFGMGDNGTASAKSNSVDNVLEILDGAEFKVDNLFVHGMNTKVVVSNATLTAGSWESGGHGVWLGRQTSKGVQLVLRGSAPRVQSQYEGSHSWSLMMQNGSILRYEIPAEGYPKGHVAVELGGIYVDNPAVAKERLEIECSAWAAAADDKPAECILFRMKENVSTEYKQWLALQDLNLPENVKLVVRGTDIVLHRRGGGLTLILK